jgi:hypothetical protein
VVTVKKLQEKYIKKRMYRLEQLINPLKEANEIDNSNSNN